MVSRPLRTRRLIARACFVTTSALLAAAAPLASGQSIPATWNSSTTGDWSVDAHWSTAQSPRNGSPLPTSTYDAFIPVVPNAYNSYTISITSATVVNSINVTTPAATLVLDNHAFLSATNGIVMSSGNLRLASGELADTTLNAFGGAYVEVYPSPITGGGGFANYVTLHNVTFDANATLQPAATSYYGDAAPGSIVVRDSLTITSNHVLSIYASTGTSAFVRFDGATHLAGAGTISFEAYAQYGTNGFLQFSGDSTTIDPGVTIATGPYGGTVAATGATPASNSGTFWSRTPGQTLTIMGSWSSLGTLKVSDGTLDVQTPVSGPMLSSVVQTGGTLLLSKPVNCAGYTLAPTGATVLDSTLTGGTLAPAAGGTFTVANGVLDSVNLQGDLTATGAISLVNTQLNGRTLFLQNYGTLTLTDSLTTPGTITSSHASSSTGIVAAAPVTLGPALNVSTGGQTVRLSTTGAGAITNQGTLLADGGLLAIGGPFTNQGSIVATSSGTISFLSPSTTNSGTISLTGGTLSFAPSVSGTLVNSGVITANNAVVTLNGPLANSGSATVNGGTLNLGAALSSSPLGSFAVTGATVHLLGATPGPTGTFTNSTLAVNAPYATAQITAIPLSGPTSSISVAAGGAVDNASYTIPLSGSSIPWTLAGGSITGGSVSSTDSTPLTATAGSSTLSSLSSTAPVVVNSGATLTLSAVTLNAPMTLNTGSSASLSSVTLNAPTTINAGSSATFSNTTNVSTITLGGSLNTGASSPGTLVATPGSSLTFTGPTSNLAGVSATGATFTATSTAYVPADFRSVTATGSSFRLGSAAVLDLTADNLTLPNSNTFALAGGKITGGTIARPISAVTGTSTLDNTTLASELTLANGSATATGTVTFAPGSSVRFAGTAVGGTLTLPGNSLAGTADVIFDSTSASSPLVQGATSLTIGPNITIRTGPNLTSPTPTVGGSFMPLVNQGTISSQIAGRAITLNTSSLTNTGTIEAKNGGIIRLVGTYTPASVATVSTSTGGYAFLSGTLNNAPSGTLTISAAHAIGLGPAGSIRLGTVTTTDSTPLTVYPFSASTLASTITGAAVLTPVSLLAGSTLTATNTTFSSAISAAGATLNLNGSYSLPGGLALSAGSAANYNGTATGTIGPISVTDSTLTLNTNLDLAGATLALSPTSTLNVNGVSSTSSAATLSNTTVTGGGTVSLNFGAGSALSNVTLAGTTGLTIPATTPYAELRNGLTMNGGRLSFSSTAGGRVSIDSLAGSGEIVLDGTYGGTIGPRLSNTLNLPAGFTARTGTTGGTLLVNNVAGLVSAQTPGRPLTLSAASVTGAAEARNGGTLIVTGGLIAYNSNGVTLSTGTYNVFDGSTLSLSFGSSLYANAANLTLSGPTATVYRIQSLNTNSGSLTLTAGQKLTLTSPSLTNSGAITVGTSSALEVTGALVNPGTLTLASSSGALLVDYAGASPSTRSATTSRPATSPRPSPTPPSPTLRRPSSTSPPTPASRSTARPSSPRSRPPATPTSTAGSTPTTTPSSTAPSPWLRPTRTGPTATSTTTARSRPPTSSPSTRRTARPTASAPPSSPCANPSSARTT